MNYRVAIGTASFALEDDTPMRMLEEAGIDVVKNPFGRRPTEEELLDFLPEMDGLIAGLEPLTARVLEACPSLKVVSRIGIGLDSIDLKAAKRLGITICNTPDPPAAAVAEMTIGMMLCMTRNLMECNRDMHNGLWKKRLGPGLIGAKVLIVGFGRVGKKVAQLLRPFDCEVLVHDPFIEQRFSDVRFVEMEEGLAEADIVTLHCSGGETIIGKDQIQQMKKGSCLLNSARGELVDEKSLVSGLETGTIEAAWFDSFEIEPYIGALLGEDRMYLTPHNATFSRKCRLDMETQGVQNLLIALDS